MLRKIVEARRMIAMASAGGIGAWGLYTYRDTHVEWRNQIALTFLGDPQQRAVVYPAPTPRRCQIVTERGAVHFDAKRDTGIARQVPLEAFRRFDADVRTR